MAPKRDRKRAQAKAARATPSPEPQREDVVARWKGAALRVLEHRAFLPAALTLGAILRLAHLSAFASSPFADRLQLDHLYYDDWAQRIAAGELVGERPFFVDPLYAYVLGGLYAAVGRSLAGVRVLQACLGLGTAYLTARLGRRALASRPLGNLAGALAAIVIPSVFAETAIEKTTLATFLCVATLAALFWPHRRAPLVAGVLAGLSVLARANLLPLLVVGVIAYGWWGAGEQQAEPEAAAPSPRPWLPPRPALVRALSFAGVTLLFVVLSAAHNIAASGEVVPLTSNAGQNLYIGQHEGNEIGAYDSPPFVRPDPQYEEGDFRAEAERQEGRTLSAAEVSAHFRGAALDAMAADPARAATRTLRKLRLALHRFDVPDNDNVEVVQEVSPVLGSPVLWLGDLVPLAILGAVVGWRRRRETRALAVFGALYVAGLCAFFVLGRFRLPLVPVLCVLSVGGLAWLARELAMRSSRAAIAAVCVAVALVLCIHRPDWMEDLRTRGLAVSLHNLAEVYAAAGDEDRAIQIYERAVSTSEQTVLASLRTLGEIYLRRGDYGRAEGHMRAVLRHRPDSQRGRDALVRLYEAMARDAERCSDPSVKDGLVAAYEGAGRSADAERARSAPPCTAPTGQQGDAGGFAEGMRLARDGQYAEAMTVLRNAIASGPYDENTRYALGNLMERHASPEEMVTYYSQAVATDPKPQTSHYFWALGLERSGDTEGAIAELRRALEVDPAHEMSQLRWGAILERQGQLEEALAHYREAVRIHPEFREAQQACAAALDRLGRAEEAEEHRQLAARADPSSPRRFLYWGRYLVDAGRFAAAVPELERAVAALPEDAEARALLARARAQAGPDAAGSAGDSSSGVLESDARAAMMGVLAEEPPGSPVWFAHAAAYAGSAEMARALAAVFAEAGWSVRGTTTVPFAVRPGVFVFAADEEPPAYVGRAKDALDAAGLAPSFATGYRGYYEEQRNSRSDFNGFPMTPDQTYVIAVGRR